MVEPGVGARDRFVISSGDEFRANIEDDAGITSRGQPFTIDLGPPQLSESDEDCAATECEQILLRFGQGTGVSESFRVVVDEEQTGFCLCGQDGRDTGYERQIDPESPHLRIGRECSEFRICAHEIESVEGPQSRSDAHRRSDKLIDDDFRLRFRMLSTRARFGTCTLDPRRRTRLREVRVGPFMVTADRRDEGSPGDGRRQEEVTVDVPGSGRALDLIE